MWLLKYYRIYRKNSSILSSQFFFSTSCTHGSGGLFSVFFSYSCCNKQPQTSWLKTTQTLSNSCKGQSLKWVLGTKIKVSRGTKIKVSRGLCSFLEALGPF